MTTDDRQRRLLAAWRHAVEPTENDRVRVRLAIQRAEGRPRRVAPMRSTIVIAIVAAAATLVLVMAWSAMRTDAQLGRRAPSHDEAVHGVDGARTDTIRDRSPDPMPAVLPTLRASEATVASPPRPIQVPAASLAPTTSPSAADEAAFVRRIVDALDRRDFPEVLRLADDHGVRFATGTLAPEARALRVLALCELGRVAQGRGEAAVFLRTHPRAPYRARIARACNLDGEGE